MPSFNNCEGEETTIVGPVTGSNSQVEVPIKSQNIEGLLTRILAELKVANFHLATLTGEEIKIEDISDG